MMKVQPILDSGDLKQIKNDAGKPASKSRFKRMLEKQFTSILRSSSSEKLTEVHGGTDLEPSSVCLAKMVQNFIEEDDKPTKCCNCFNGHGDLSDEEFESPSGEAAEILKCLVPCASLRERNLLADTARLVDSRSKNCKRNTSLREFVAEGLVALGYDASICKSKWDQTPAHPAGEYEYIDVIFKTSEGGTERLIIDLEFKSEFEIARSTSQYKAVLQSLPSIFVGRTERLQQIVVIASEAAKQSLKKKGFHIPPWRKSDYMRAKWLSPYKRTAENDETGKEKGKEKEKLSPAKSEVSVISLKPSGVLSAASFSGDFELQFCDSGSFGARETDSDGSQMRVVVTEWTPPTIKPKDVQKEGRIVTGLASALLEKP